MHRLLLVLLLVGLIADQTGMGTTAYFTDAELNAGNTFLAWIANRWVQTTQGDFQGGVLNNVDIFSSPGDVKLAATSTSNVTTKSPTWNTGEAWTNPTFAYADGTGAATITSGTPSGSNVWGNFGFSLTDHNITRVRVRYDAWSTPVAPTFQAAGTPVGGAGAISPAWPAHQPGDVALLFVETANQAANPFLSVPAGFVEVPNSPQGTGTAGGLSATRLAVYWCRATASSMPAPTVADSGDHQYAVILTFRNVIASGDPWDVTAGGVKPTASTSVTFGAVTTSVPNTLIVLAASHQLDRAGAQFSAWTNPNLSGLTERHDAGTTAGNGGGIAVATGVMAHAGSTGTTTATVTSSINAWMTIALLPDLPEQIRVDVSWDGGTSWSPKQTTNTTVAEVTYWYDVTGVTNWTPDKLADGQLLVRADAQTIGAAGTVNLDWLAVEVSYGEQSYVSSGTIASQVFDTEVAGASWDRLFWDETLQSNTDITFEVRASDTAFTKDAATPSWTFVGGTSPVTSGLPSGRYVQWRATLTTSDTSKTPTLHEVIVEYY